MMRVGKQIHKDQIAHDDIPRSYIFRIGHFMNQFYSTANDHRFLHSIASYKYRSQELRMKLELVSMDPRTLTVPVLENVHASISMSGSLSPLDAYIETIGLPSDTEKRIAKSPFARSQMQVMVAEGVSTAMRYRSQQMYQKIVAKLQELITGTPGNIGIFAASYSVLNGILDAKLEDHIDKPLFIEQPKMTSRENDPLIRQFRAAKNNGGGVLLGVIGGRNSEGTDFSGEDMVSVAVVGVPYATPTLAVKKQIAYFEQEFPKRGRYYAYHLPAIKRASQAAGRPIRSLNDRGVILLLDERFASSYCYNALPSWLGENIEILPDIENLINRRVTRFFNS
jgi:DNA excision repair protein ERCC-2